MPHNIEVVVEFPEVDTTHKLPLTDLTGRKGRWDVVCRCILATKHLSSAFNITFIGVFSNKTNPLLIRIPSDQWDTWPSTEADIAVRINQIISREDMKSSGSIYDFHQFEREIFNKNTILIRLCETGRDIKELVSSLTVNSNLQFLIGAERGYLPLIENWLHNRQVKEISLGTQSYLTSQCLLLLGYYLQDFPSTIIKP